MVRCVCCPYRGPQRGSQHILHCWVFPKPLVTLAPGGDLMLPTSANTLEYIVLVHKPIRIYLLFKKSNQGRVAHVEIFRG